ncbi:protein TRACHEARY ELEMENT DIFFERENTIATION-RELATED 7A-like [Schistocerca americana]|uniref:protein TRACHEARY ELEMENT DIFFERENTIATION-RELATED 7A-like n=1 Tax=Schistocerca americana TaxID=7009 RepID=UPI001F4F9FBA|nr:protein TRACHEARY ELEMENT DIFFERENTIATION-RELATED 7A-like [Schistocerca americana]
MSTTEGAESHEIYLTQLEASRIPPPQPTTPPTAPPPLLRLPSSPSPLPVQSPAPDGRFSPSPRQHPRPSPSPPPPPPPRTSVVPEPMDAEAAETPPPRSPIEVVALPPHPSIHSGGARPFSRAVSPPLASNSGPRVDSTPRQFHCLLRPPGSLQPSSEALLNDAASFQGGGMWYL